jgi:hypothetical protein
VLELFMRLAGASEESIASGRDRHPKALVPVLERFFGA